MTKSTVSVSTSEDVSSKPKCVQLRVPAETEYLELIRAVVSGVAIRMGFGPGEAAEIEMAVDEACTNVIVHAYGRKPGHRAGQDAPLEEIDLQMTFAQDRIVVLILDRARPFSPEPFDDANIKKYLMQRKGHGLGIYIMKRFMHEVKYSFKPGVGNELQLVRYLGLPRAT
jgi:serine/threonine-protein kinase RsbW